MNWADARLSVAWGHWPPFSYITPQGSLDGLDVTLTRQILSQAGLEARFRNLPWARALHLIKQQQLDLAMGALDTPETCWGTWGRTDRGSPPPCKWSSAW